jgi:hypothetical protein
MMDERVERWAAVAGAAIVLLLIAAVAVGIYPSWPVAAAAFKGVEVLGSLTAVGTCAAAIVALYVASKSERRVERERMQVARLVAAEISIRLADSVRKLGQLVSLLNDDSEIDDKRRTLSHVAQFAKAHATLLGRETLVGLIPLPNEAAHRIARALDFLTLIERDLGNYESLLKDGSPNRISSLHRRIGKIVGQAHAELTAASAECTEAAELDTPMIPPA